MAVFAGVKTKIRRVNTRKPFKGYGPLQKYVYEQLQDLFDDSIGAFLEVLSSAIVRDTGMSEGMLRPLADRVKFKLAVKQSMKGKGPHWTNRYNSSSFSSGLSGQMKSESLGIRAGKRAFDINYGSPKRMIFDFDFKINVLQFFLNETGLGNSKQWTSHQLEPAKEAFINYWNDNAARYVSSKVLHEYLASGKMPFTISAEMIKHG